MTSWTTVGLATSSWTNDHYDFKNIWAEWQTYTWGQIGG